HRKSLHYLVAWCVAFSLSAFATAEGQQPLFHIQAHRGAGIAMPENTLDSFRWAWKLGVTPEADLRTTRDGTIVCFHDPDLSRVVSNAQESEKKSRIEDLPLAGVQTLEVGSFRGSQFAGQHVPTL